MGLGGVVSDQLVNDMRTIWRNGYAVKTRTKTIAGERYSSPVSVRRRVAVMGSPRVDRIGWPTDAPMVKRSSPARQAISRMESAAALRRERRGRVPVRESV